MRTVGHMAYFVPQMEYYFQQVEKGQHAHDLDASNDLVFVKLHASWNLMLSYADVLKFRKPLKKMLLEGELKKDEAKIVTKKENDEILTALSVRRAR
ncbi:hypothetical protein Ciccas_005435 [Cichlidogyrus casuarinus]|uniref:Anoctamin dimerisation domain-containing protein n=1 Tax=Cichlidogyrus casuarinus TaxID=1844966 RepID=A0ABD2Q8N5_9PLAT